jgi:hypothetical protein
MQCVFYSTMMSLYRGHATPYIEVEQHHVIRPLPH